MEIQEMFAPKKQKFNGDVEVKIIDNGFMVAHYSPEEERAKILYFADAVNLAEYLSGLATLYQREISHSLARGFDLAREN